MIVIALLAYLRGVGASPGGRIAFVGGAIIVIVAGIRIVGITNASGLALIGGRTPVLAIRTDTDPALGLIAGLMVRTLDGNAWLTLTIVASFVSVTDLAIIAIRVLGTLTNTINTAGGSRTLTEPRFAALFISASESVSASGYIFAGVATGIAIVGVAVIAFFRTVFDTIAAFYVFAKTGGVIANFS